MSGRSRRSSSADRTLLLRSARRYLPEARAEDALQQAFIAAWKALQRGDEVRDLRAWLYRIVHNTALNQLRSAGYDYAELEESLRGGPAPQEEMERRAVVHQTLSGLAALPERQREALLQIAIEGRSQEEVARELGVTEGAVRQLVHRARLTLRAAATAVDPTAGRLLGRRGGRGERSRTAERGADRGADRGRRRERVRGQGGNRRRDRDHDRRRRRPHHRHQSRRTAGPGRAPAGRGRARARAR